MSTGQVEFDGLDPWPAGIEIVECVVQGQMIDLHNDCTLLRAEITCGPAVDLRLRFVRDADRRHICLTFADVRGLNFRQDASPGAGRLSWDPSEVETFYGVEYQLDGDARFSVSTIVGTYAFACTYVRATLEGDGG